MKILELPLEEAVVKAAEQNFERDRKVGLVKRREWLELQSEYEEEARHLLLTSGENYEPEDHSPKIILKRTTT